MVRVDKTSINDILIDGKPTSVMLNTNGNIVWEKIDDSIEFAGSRGGVVSYEIDVPKWCNYLEYILIGGGGGGEAGSGSDAQSGRPANGGEISTGSYSIPRYLDRGTTVFRVQGSVGTGGKGGLSGGGTGRHGQNGGDSLLFVIRKTPTEETVVYTHRVDGGFGGPLSNRARGGDSGGTPSVYAPRYISRAAEAGVGPNRQPLENRYGVGGGGGDGGFFNNYNVGGIGAPGAALVAFGGYPESREPGVVQIDMAVGNTLTARDQLRAALVDYGTTYDTVTELPFRIEIVGTGNSLFDLFSGCQSLRHVDSFDLGGATIAQGMFHGCQNLQTVGDLDMRNVTNANYMFWLCRSLRDGQVRLYNRHPSITTQQWLANSGLTSDPFDTTP